MLVSDHLLNAAFDIDGQFGAGHARANPGLLGACVVAAAVNFVGLLLADELSGRRASLAATPASGTASHRRENRRGEP
jgi:hypothetical protein